jgi:serine/threonine protein kinase
MNKKTLAKKFIGNGKNALDCVREELKVLKKMDHPNVIWLYEIIDDPKKDSIYLVQEWYTKGSLLDQVDSNLVRVGLPSVQV